MSSFPPSSKEKAQAIAANIPDQYTRKFVERSLANGANLHDMVRAFHMMYKMPIVAPTEADTGFGHITRERLAMRFWLIVEEFMELCEAMDIRADIEFMYQDEEDRWIKAGDLGTMLLNHDTLSSEDLQRIVGVRLRDAIENTEERNMIDVADACGDLKYVIAGFEFEVGIPGQAVLEEIQASNMSKANADGTVTYRYDGKVLKGSNYFKANIGKVLAGQGMRLNHYTFS